jgi:hypothetical protein
VQAIPVVISAAAGFQAAGIYRAGEMAFGGMNLLVGITTQTLLARGPRKPRSAFVKISLAFCLVGVLNGLAVALVPDVVLRALVGPVEPLLRDVLLLVTVQRCALAVRMIGAILLVPLVPARTYGLFEVIAAVVALAALVGGGTAFGLAGALSGLAAAELALSLMYLFLIRTGAANQATDDATRREDDATSAEALDLPTVAVAITTVGRPELDRLLESLVSSSLPPVAVAIANQSGRPLKLERTEFPFRLDVVDSGGGVSRGRNDAVGALRGEGDILAFPNDDSIYPPSCLEDVAKAFEMAPQASAIACSLVERGRPRFILPRGGFLDRITVWRALEPSMFFRHEVFEEMSGFREDLGTGCSTPWQSGDGTDLLLRILEKGGVAIGRPEISVIGTGERRDLDADALVAKHRGYARGMGRVYRLHPYPLWVRARILVSPWLSLREHDPSINLSLRLAVARSVGRAEGLAGKVFTAKPHHWQQPQGPAGT